MEQAIRFFCHVSKTSALHLEYSPSGVAAVPGSPVADNQLWGYVDSDWAGCPDTRRSTSGNVLILNGTAVSWRFKSQSIFALSSAEAELIAASSMVQESIFLRKFLYNLYFKQNSPTPMFADMRRLFIGPRARLVAVIVLSKLISASNKYMMHASKAFFCFRKLILNLMVQIF